MGIRTPDLLHAISRRPIHRSTSVQVTVPQRALQSAQVRVSCGTFVLYSPPIRKRPQTLRTPVVPPVTPAAGPVFVLALRRLCPGLEAYGRSSERAEGLVQPVEHALFEEGAGHRLAVHVRALGLGERHEHLGCGQGGAEAL
jgi:hypothetical protein